MSHQSINPCNDELVKSFEKHTDPHLETAIASAVSCSHSWRNLTFPEREVIVAKAAAIMRSVRMSLRGWSHLKWASFSRSRSEN